MTESDSPSCALATAGAAGVVLSLFVTASDVTALGGNLDEPSNGRVVRGALERVVVLGAIAALRAPFVGLVVPPRVAKVFLSVTLELSNVDRRFVLDIVFLGPVPLLHDGDTPTTRLAGLDAGGFLFSPSDSTAGFLASSVKPVDILDLCPMLAAVAAVTLLGGCRPAAPAMVRVGDLLHTLKGGWRDRLTAGGTIH